MKKEEFTIVSDYDGLAVKGFAYEPENSPRGIVQLVHGMCEHKERYEELASFLCEKGYVVVCHDHRGHGESVKEEKDLGWFGDGTGKAVVDDTAKVTDLAKEKYPDIPLVLFGHSMGSLVVRCYLKKYEDKLDKLIVCGSPSKNPLVGVALALTKTIALFRGKRHRSKLLSYLATGSGDKRFKGEGKGAWLSKNRANIEKYAKDPKCGFTFTCNGFENLFRLLKDTYKKKGYSAKKNDLPVLFIAGADDPVIVSEKAWRSSMDFMGSVGYGNVTGKLYAGARHEIHNETERELVYKDLLSFIEKGSL